MQTDDKISVVVPVYNKEKYIDTCIDSLCGQTYKNIEIILVDDGSVDNSALICDGWSARDARVKIFHIQNSGVGFARNMGIQNSTGKYIMFVDADDTVEKNCIQVLHSIMKNNHDVDMAVSALNVVKNENKEVRILVNEGLYDRKNYIIQISHCNMNYNFTGPYAKLIKKTLLENDVRFEEKDNLGEDFIFNIKLLQNIAYIYVSAMPLYNYRIDTIGSLAKSKHKTEYYYTRYRYMHQQWHNMLKQNSCFLECQDDIYRFENLIVKLVSRNIVFDDDFRNYKEKKKALIKYRDMFIKSGYLISQKNNVFYVKMQVRIIVLCVKYKAFLLLYFILKVRKIFK